ncbi:restriction endonuclease subunit S [Deferribacter thermophilus]|uniref:restriction endonuclease subunit S n=1 Tax=Deferribacter thermophilus TaxID=53573 RepID=UPI003C14B43E
MSEKIPEGWKKVKLGEVVIFNYGKSLPKKERIKGNIPVYSSAGITGWHNKALVNSKGIIVGRKGTIGKVYKSKVPFYPIDTCYYILPSEKYEFDFMYYLLIYLKLDKLNEDSAVPGLNRNTAYSQEIFLPPLPEQKAIASVLSSLDDKIDLLHRQNQTLEKMAETLFRKWFIEDAKDDWEEVSLGDSDLATIISSGIEKFEGEKIYLATGDVQDTNITGGVKITYENRPSRANMQPVKFSVWFAKKGGVRKLIMFDDYSDIDKYILSTGFSGLKTNELSHYYIWCFVLTKEFQEIKDSFVSGSVQPDITNEGIKQITILKPDNQTLIKFNEIVKPLFYKYQQNKLQIQTLENLRDTLLPKLMSGEVRVKYEL